MAAAESEPKIIAAKGNAFSAAKDSRGGMTGVGLPAASQGLGRRTTRGDVYVAAAVFCISFGYFYAFRRLGWFMQDEGVLYYQYLRVYRGQLPYRDFFVGYPPLVYYLNALAFYVFGISINAIRVLMGVLNATTAAMLYLVARRVTSRGFALIPAALLPALHPADSAVMIFHNSPYPSWYALAFGVAGTWAMLRALEAGTERRRALWLVATGVLGGLTFLSKQNAGIFFLWGVSGYLISFPGDLSPKFEIRNSKFEIRTGVRIAYLSLIPLAAIVLVKSYLSVVTVAFFVVPLAALAALGGANRGPAPVSEAQPLSGAGAWWALIAVGAGVAVTVAPWIAYLGAQIGVEPFLKTLFPIGTDIDVNTYVPIPAPQEITLLLLAPLALWGLLPWIPRQRWPRITSSGLVRLRRLLAAAATTMLVVALGAQAAVIERLVGFNYNLWQIYYTTSDAIDNLAAYGALLVLFGAAAVAWRQRRGLARVRLPTKEGPGKRGALAQGVALGLRIAALSGLRASGVRAASGRPPQRGSHSSARGSAPGGSPASESVPPADPPPAAFLCILWIAACTFLVYYPRMDNAHLVTAVPLVCVIGAAMLPRFRQGVADVLNGRRQRRALAGFNAACLAVMVFVVGLKAAPKVYSRVMLARTAGGLGWVETPQVRLRFARGDIYVPIYLQHSRVHNQAFNDLIAYLDRHLEPGAPIFAFPALPMVYFISGHDNVTKQDYFFGDNVSFSEQLDVIRTLERARVPVVVAVNDPTEYFVMKGKDYTRLLWTYLRRRYYVERRIGPYDVMRRYEETTVPEQ